MEMDNTIICGDCEWKWDENTGGWCPMAVKNKTNPATYGGIDPKISATTTHPIRNSRTLPTRNWLMYPKSKENSKIQTLKYYMLYGARSALRNDEYYF